MSAEGKAYKSRVSQIVSEMVDLSMITDQVFVRVDLYPPDNRKRDLDNFAGKALFDALVDARVIDDDSQIRGTQALFHNEKYKGGLAVVQIHPIESVRFMFDDEISD